MSLYRTMTEMNMLEDYMFLDEQKFWLKVSINVSKSLTHTFEKWK